MAIKPRINNHANRPRVTDSLFRPPNDTTQTDQDVRDVRSLCKKKRKTRQHPIASYSGDTIDMEEIEAIIFRMKEKGSNVYHTSCKERFDIASNELVSLWRQMLVKWMFYVVDCCDLQRHAVAAAAYFLDVAMLRDLCRTREEHQLAAATALQMALKTFDTAVIKLDKLVELGRGLFTKEDVSIMEMKIITSLNWNLHPPTIYCFLRQYERLAPSKVTDLARKVLDKVTKIIAEEMVLDERYIKYCPSVQGLSVLLVALDFVPDDCLPSCLRRTFESRLYAMAKADEDSTMFSKVNKKIYKTLKRRDKFQVIIDVTSSKTKGARVYQRALRNVKKNTKKTRPGSKNTCEHHSPRDVKAKVSLKI
jgi:hypothetical protein